VLQRALEETTRIGLHAVERHAPPTGQGAWRHILPGELGGGLETELASLALRAYEALECRDFARADFRLDAAGTPHFLEINPLPTFAEDGSFGILAELEGRSAEALLAEVIEAGLARLGIGGLGIGELATGKMATGKLETGQLEFGASEMETSRNEGGRR
jgi:D-alanine-D-alanine ligase